MIGDSPSLSIVNFPHPQYSVELMENRRFGTVVATLRASRSDGRDRRIRYSIADGNNAGVFEIDNAGTFTVVFIAIKRYNIALF